MATYSKTKTSFYRRLYVAYLIDNGINTVPAITQSCGMPRRTAQDTILALAELDIECVFVGGNKNGTYRIAEWGGISPEWVKGRIRDIEQVLGFTQHTHQ